MKQISQPIRDVDVELISFHDENLYETFTNALHLDVTEVASMDEAIEKIKARHPIAFVPLEKGSFILVKKRENGLTLSQNGVSRQQRDESV